jgi:hypothetical protein
MKKNYRKYVTTSFKINSRGLMGTNIAEEPAASIFREGVFVYIVTHPGNATRI